MSLRAGGVDLSMPHLDPLKRLREIRNEESHLERSKEALKPERDRLIRWAVSRGSTQGELEIATGLDQSTISRIVKGSEDDD